MNAIFKLFVKNEDSFIKRWMNKVHLAFPYSTISLKRDKNIWVIVCDEYTEAKQEFRDSALDFLTSFSRSFKNKDVIIVSDRDSFYRFDEFDYIIEKGRRPILMDNIVLYEERIEINPDQVKNEALETTIFQTPILHKNVHDYNVSVNEWETADCLIHCSI